MNEDKFWKLIDETRVEAGTDFSERVQTLKDKLSNLSAGDIEKFDSIYFEQIVNAYRWPLWGAAYVINGGCSDDGFRYFCDWLISEGREMYDAALEDPEALAELDDVEDFSFEEFGYAALEAYEEKTGKDIPENDQAYPDEPSGEQWDEGDLGRLYPNLADKYGW
ncbi:MAG: DUF4240 domain-containing protein [Gammaproteobacteria bacterium]|nr:DUF4240 domain-containing protein [Gammaproteobacteria bacterium]MDH5801497.1 DUF4240 domain-containing protein [Gammaproteobacteria bacterium]